MDILPFCSVIGVPIVWMLMLFAESRLCGWSTLSKKYRNDNSIIDWTGWQNGTFSITNYKGCLWLAATAEGLYIKTGPLFLFRPFHPPMLIPWADIISVEEKKSLFHYPNLVEIQLKDNPFNISLSKKAFAESHRFLGDKLILLDKKS